MSISSSPQMSSLFCSCIIATISRDTLTRAIDSVLSQTLGGGDFELIIVNDSGKPLQEHYWQRSNKIQVINTNRRERSIARNTGAAAAKGRFLHFLDDDDWLAPKAYHHFWELSQSTNAKWLYGMTQLLDREDKPTIVLKHGINGNCFIQVMAGEWIPLQSSLIERKTFIRIGGFNPLLTGPEDMDLLRRFLLEEGIAETPNLIANVIMGGEGSTTDYVHHPQASRWAREIILDAPAAYTRMRSSAVNPAWRGRKVRVYLTSAVWNLEHRRLFTAISRMFFFAASILTSGTGMFSRDFWHAVSKPYASVTFEKGIQEARKAN